MQPPNHLQVEINQATSAQNAVSRKNTLLWMLGFGFGCFALGVASACVILPSGWHADSLQRLAAHHVVAAYSPIATPVHTNPDNARASMRPSGFPLPQIYPIQPPSRSDVRLGLVEPAPPEGFEWGITTKAERSLFNSSAFTSRANAEPTDVNLGDMPYDKAWFGTPKLRAQDPTPESAEGASMPMHVLDNAVKAYPPQTNEPTPTSVKFSSLRKRLGSSLPQIYSIRQPSRSNVRLGLVEPGPPEGFEWGITTKAKRSLFNSQAFTSRANAEPTDVNLGDKPYDKAWFGTPKLRAQDPTPESAEGASVPMHMLDGAVKAHPSRTNEPTPASVKGSSLRKRLGARLGTFWGR